MPYGPITVFTGNIASGTSTLTALDVSKSWRSVSLELTTMSTGAAVSLWASSDGSTMRQLAERVHTSSVQWQTLTVGTATSNWIVPIPAGYRYYGLTTSATVAGGVVAKFICCD